MLSNYPYTYPMHKNPIGHKTHIPDMPFKKTSALPEHPKLAMAYVPFQTDLNVYDEMKALKCGTLFLCLDKPFHGCGAR